MVDVLWNDSNSYEFHQSWTVRRLAGKFRFIKTDAAISCSKRAQFVCVITFCLLEKHEWVANHISWGIHPVSRGETCCPTVRSTVWWTFSRFDNRTLLCANYKNILWFNQRQWLYRKYAQYLGVIKSSMCKSKWKYARADKRVPDHWRTKPRYSTFTPE